MFYTDIVLAAINMILLVGGVATLAYNARCSGTTIDTLYRATAVVMHEFPVAIWIYIGGCLVYIAIGIAALVFGFTYFGLSMLITAAMSSYSTAYFFSLHRQIARGIPIL